MARKVRSAAEKELSTVREIVKSFRKKGAGFFLDTNNEIWVRLPLGFPKILIDAIKTILSSLQSELRKLPQVTSGSMSCVQCGSPVLVEQQGKQQGQSFVEWHCRACSIAGVLLFRRMTFFRFSSLID